MVFSDPVFLFAFLPAVLAVHWLGGWRRRNWWLCLVGATFYLAGAGALLLLLAWTIVVNHAAARFIAAHRETEPRRARLALRAVVTVDLGALAVWKYGGFAVEQGTALLRGIGVDAHASVSLVLPIAISFFTFQVVSYVVDVSRGTAAPARRLVDFAAYILLFPHLIAGPIVRYASIEDDLVATPRHRLDDFAVGAPRFFWGLAKKVLIADQVSAVVNEVFSLPDNRLTSSVAWVGVAAYAIQIYFDFSGYSDMAIGLARMLGFDFPENFDRPYSAHSVTDFWRRWHMSLSSWFRDYVYIPLGGNRGSAWRTYRNLSVVFLLTGLWHGANWTFVVWGAFHGACLVVERLTGTGTLDAGRWAAPRRALTFALVCVGWAIFRADDLGQGVAMVRAMVTPRGWSLPVTVTEVLSSQRIVWFAIGGLVVLLPRMPAFGRRLTELAGARADAIRLAVVATAAPLASLYALSGTFSPFLYFQF